jgi:hypothetical protein
MKRVLAVLLAAPVLTYAADYTPRAATISATAVKTTLHLKSPDRFDAQTVHYVFDVPGGGVAGADVVGQDPKDLDRVAIGCRRFDASGNTRLREDSQTPCGKVFSSALGLFVDRSDELIDKLIGQARVMGKEYSMARYNLGGLVFEYGNDGILVIRKDVGK